MSAPPQTTSVRPELNSPATQIVGDRETYLGQGAREVGRRVSDTQFELFVVGDPTAALQQRLESTVPDFIALHDLGGVASEESLSALTRRFGARRQTLSIRREGQGVALAEIPFVEVPAVDGTSLRVYGGSINADTRTRHQIAQLLLAHSRLGVMLIPDTPRHALAGALKPVRDAIARGPWPNGDLLVAPLALLPGLPVEASTLAGRSGVTVRLLPALARVGDLWQHIADTWNAMQSRTGGLRRLSGATPPAAPPEPQQVPSWEAPTMPMDLRSPPPPAAAFAISAGFAPLSVAAAPARLTSPLAASPAAAAAPTHVPGSPAAARLPAMPAASPMPVPGRTGWADYACRCAALRGVISSCVFDQPAQRLIAQAGGRPSGERLTTQGAILAATMIEAGRALGAGIAFRDALITIGSYQLVLHAVPGHPGVMLHLVVDSRQGSAAMARAQVEKLDP